ncbi:MAG: ankyrin repeat domain-containing protein [Pseudomonadota bacterium]
MKKLLCLAALAAALSTTLSAHAGSFEDYFRAVHADNPGAIRNLLNRGFDPNTRDERGQTGLLIALREPSPKVIDVLLSSPQTDVNARNASDESPLMLAAIKGQSDLVDKLLTRDAAVNKPGWTPLHYAASSGQLSIMKTLLDKYAFIDAQSPNGTTPLMMAAMYGSSESVKLLIEEGADPLMKNELGMTALSFAQQGKRPDAIEMLTAAMRAKQPAGGKW